MRIEYHRTLIADQARNAAFYEALRAAIVPGETVVADIGAGTGLIGLMAAKLGAREVFLYESAEIAGVAHEMIARNKARNCHLMACHSTEMVDPPQVDLIVSETLGNYALEENIIDTLNDARARFLKPGGKIIPHRIRQFVSPVVSDRLHRELSAWDDVGYGLDFKTAKAMSLNNVYVRTMQREELDDPAGQVWDEVDLAKPAKPARKGEAVWLSERGMQVFGLCVWWVADLVAAVNLSTAPGSQATHWEQLYFPMMSPMTVEAGGRFRAQIRSTSSEEAGTHLSWSVARVEASGKVIERQSMDLDKGYLP